jgi:electron transport complex protein RnfG
MREMISMVVVLTVLSAFSGGLLATVRSNTQDRIENQVLKFEKAPAVKAILSEVSNDPMQDRFKLTDDDEEITFFVGKKEGTPESIAFETKGKGFEALIGLMVGIDLTTDSLIGVRVTTHSETPGVGSRAKDDPAFARQFSGKSLDKGFAVKSDNGEIDAISGATITSKGVCIAATKAQALYNKLKPEIKTKINNLAN